MVHSLGMRLSCFALRSAHNVCQLGELMVDERQDGGLAMAGIRS